MNVEAVERIADAVLYEGYLLYPYRASSTKNRFRWQFGIVAPRPSGDDEGEPWFSQTECLIDATPACRLRVRVRCMTLEDPRGVRRTVDVDPIPVATAGHGCAVPLGLNDINARLVIETSTWGPALAGPSESPSPGGLIKIRLRLENLEPWRSEFAGDRAALLRRSLVSAHLLLGVDGGVFISLLEPRPGYKDAVASCTNRHTFPVLVGDRAQPDTMLSSPIVLYDYPVIAPESPGDLCDSTEIDEILSLRILTLTDDEKREARDTDPLAAGIIDRTEAMSAGTLASLHGTMRSADFFNPAGEAPPETATAVVAGGGTVANGSRVVLRPNRRADAMDMFLDGQAATVAGVYRDVDDRVHVAVTVDADPAAELHGSFGRYFYFNPDEIELRRV